MSEITYLCPFCGGTVSVGRDAGGKVLPCPFCDGKSIVPALVAAAPDVSFVIVPPSPSRHRAAKKDGSNSTLAYIVAFSVGLAFIAGVVVYRTGQSKQSSSRSQDSDFFAIVILNYEFFAIDVLSSVVDEEKYKSSLCFQTGDRQAVLNATVERIQDLSASLQKIGRATYSAEMEYQENEMLFPSRVAEARALEPLTK